MAVMKDDIDNGKIAVVSVVGCLLVVATIFLVQAFYFHLNDKLRAESKVSRGAERRTYVSEQQAKLNSYGWVDQGKGVVRIPVERAMSLVAAEHQAKPKQAATPTDGEEASAPSNGNGAVATDGNGHKAASNGHKSRGTTVQAGGTHP